MIKFFRKIRQNLLSENKFSKYLIYAIGEIVLVVIGILIALQINSWNQFKKDRLEELSILTRFENDLQEDLNRINLLYKYNERLVRDLRVIIRGLSNKDLGRDIFAERSKNMTRYATYDKIDGTYKETVSAGKLSLIVDDAIRDEILKFYETAESDFPVDFIIESQMEKYIMPTFFKTLGYTKEFAFVTTMEPNEFESIDMDLIYNDKEYRSVLTSKLGMLNVQIEQWREQQKRIEYLLEIITQEINDRWK
jgi:hypothetical protein